MKSTRIFLLSFLLVIIMIYSSCSKGSSNNTVPPPTCSGTAFSYATDVRPIFVASCTISGCHDAASTNTGGPFTTWALIHAKAATVEAQVNAGIMPQTGSITADQKKKIVCWVESGAQNN